jgi:hypothetical protein
MASLVHDESTPTPAEISAHAGAYHRFMLGLKWTAIHLATLIVFLTLWFATPAGFGWGLIGGLIVLGVGVYAMTHGLAHSTERDNPGALEGG